MEKYFITTAIAYTSKTPHIGNVYEAVFTDALARYKRQRGFDVYFLTGTDEHGQKIQKQAEDEGKTPQELVDGVAGSVRAIWDRMNVSYDQFIRTTDPKHKLVVQKLFRRLFDKGDIYKGQYTGLYCLPCEGFYTETQVEDAGGVCPSCGATVQKTEEEAYFFKLSNYTDRLRAHIEQNPEFITPELRRNEMVKNFLDAGLTDLCVSRTSFTWGVPVDFDPGHVVYVWIDALSNYITALGYDFDKPDPLFTKYWPADVHIIGKDILRFHTIYWPIFLMALDIPLPRQVFGHPWLLMGADKMSKSRGNVVYAQDLADEFGVDAVRYYMLREMPYASDGSFTRAQFIGRLNSDLANDLGNLLSRTVAMVEKYFGGTLPPERVSGDFDEALMETAREVEARFAENMDRFQTAAALSEVWRLIGRANKYIDETLPWVLAKDEKDRARLGTVLFHLCDVLRRVAYLITPLLPETGPEILRQVGPEGGSVTRGAVMFPRVEEEKADEDVAKDKAKADKKAVKAAEKTAKKAEEAKPEEKATTDPIDIGHFAAVDIRVARVLSCESVPKSDKLLCFQLDTGTQRQVVSGIAEAYKPEELIGRHLLCVTNLKPVKLRGVESHGMLLTCETEDGVFRLIDAPEGMPPGAKVR